MAAVSAWAKPGAWALDAEEHDASASASAASPAAANNDASGEFPSLSAAKTSKKKKPQPVSLAEFNAGIRSRPKGPTANELLHLPSAPRERSADELDRSSRGFGREDSYPRSRVSDEPRRAGIDRDSIGPSRADEADNWATGKRSAAPERRERGSLGLFDSQSRADDSERWGSKKTAPPPSNGRRIEGGGGFDASSRDRRGGFEREGSDSGSWGKRAEESSGVGGRPRLVLQARSLPVASGNNGNGELKSKEGELKLKEQVAPVVRPKGSNPFGEARPREEVLKGKGQDWKEIDEKLGSVKIREAQLEGQSLWKKGGGAEVPSERIWRKAEPAEAHLASAEEVEASEVMV